MVYVYVVPAAAVVTASESSLGGPPSSPCWRSLIWTPARCSARCSASHPASGGRSAWEWADWSLWLPVNWTVGLSDCLPALRSAGWSAWRSPSWTASVPGGWFGGRSVSCRAGRPAWAWGPRSGPWAGAGSGPTAWAQMMVAVGTSLRIKREKGKWNFLFYFWCHLILKR